MSYKTYIKILLVIICFSFLSGCTRVNNQKENKKENVNTEKKDQYRMGEMFSDNKAQIIDLIEGPATFDILYEGTGPFTAKILNSDGDIVAVLADVNGNYKGSKTITAPKTG